MALSHGALLEALLFATGGPIERSRAATILGIDETALAKAITELEASLTERGLALIALHGELELRTSPQAADVIQKLRESELARDLGKASLETLALILYRGSASRTEIDWIRGVNSTAALRALSLRGLIERVEDPEDKRRARFTATIDALAHLGITRPEDLPRYQELTPLISEAEARRETVLSDATPV